MGVGSGVIGFIFHRLVVFHFIQTPDIDHRIDAVFNICECLYNLVGALAGNVLKGTGCVDFCGACVYLVAWAFISPCFSQDPGGFLDLFCCFKDGVGGIFC